ncbi:hypothetical protein [Halalkalibacter akibai]|uniref:Uncharacterized protein n=1 Tax=Halalkalibacter akibai (strain ATCC 43226 / DSM 21942 / CIP 109018 / JCM 9157 / 1139) TaxID=1236973 RepID=W4QRI6_HALA3|nr:hypothetical protein [Halalkalibacter akibai]GAE34263.1 hypothetical protein JCM9157_1309 [Halalkalibacter akibai JCM 9157]
MITFVYFLLLILMILLMSLFDSIVFERNFLYSLQVIYPFELGTRRTIVSTWAIIGLFTAVYLDYRKMKDAKKQQSTNR